MPLSPRLGALSPARRRGGPLAALLLALGLTVTAGCGGSTVSPEEAAAANRAAAGILDGTGNQVGPSGQLPGADGQVPGADGPTDVTDPGQVPGAPDPGDPDNDPRTPRTGETVPKANCTGFKNQVGITDSTITVGNVSDVSGPIPGLFVSAQQGAKAYVAYFNATNPQGICGRKLVLADKDSRTDAGADNQAYTQLCEDAFAVIGSTSAFDAGGAGAAARCGIPDLRALITQGERADCATCFSLQANGKNSMSSAIFRYWSTKDPATTSKAALVYINAGAGAENALMQEALGKKLGMNWVYTSGVDVADFNYGPYVQQLKSKGAKFVYFIGASQQSVRWAQAMQSANFKPTVAYYSPGIYDPAFIKTAGSAAEGATLYTSFTPLEESQRELNLYKQWLAQVAPGAQPTFYGIFAWSAGKLFVEKALGLGGRLDRARLVAAVRATSGWTGGGMHAPMPVGAKMPPSCIRFLKVQGGKFVPADNGRYTCSGVTTR